VGWEPGVYSIARFTLVAEGDATRVVVVQVAPTDAEQRFLSRRLSELTPRSGAATLL
jgi:hypothetical protein